MDRVVQNEELVVIVSSYNRISRVGFSVTVEEVAPIVVEGLVKPQERVDYFINHGPSKELGKEPHIFSRLSSNSKELPPPKLLSAYQHSTTFVF